MLRMGSKKRTCDLYDDRERMWQSAEGGGIDETDGVSYRSEFEGESDRTNARVIQNGLVE